MLTLEVSVDKASFKSAAEAHVAEDILPALVDALNDVARVAVTDVIGAIDTNLDRP